jgi:branched-chain amino acid transport system permease protein
MFNSLAKRLNTGSAPYIFIIFWLFVTVILLSGVSRQDFLFPLKSGILFPLFMLGPLFVISARIRQNWKIILGGFALLILVPVVGLMDGFYLELATQIGIFAALALGLNIVIGFAGLLDLGYVAFFGVGAYLWAIFTSNADTFIRANNMVPPLWTFYLFIFGGVILAGLAGLLLGLPVLRLRGDYLAIVTLGFGEMIRILATNLDHPINLTNGPLGLERVGQPPIPAFLVDFATQVQPGLERIFNRAINPEQLVYGFFFYFLVVLVIGFCILVASRLDNSPIGRAWNAIREDEVAAIAMGVPLVRMKLLAFATGAAFAGAMGVVFAAKQRFVGQESISFNQSIGILAMVIVGGMGSIRGVIVGAAAIVILDKQLLSNFSQLINNLRSIDWVVPIINWPIKNWPNQLEPTKYQRFIFGLLLILMMIFRQEGLLPARRRHIELPEGPIPEPPAGTPLARAAAPVSGD